MSEAGVPRQRPLLPLLGRRSEESQHDMGLRCGCRIQPGSPERCGMRQVQGMLRCAQHDILIVRGQLECGALAPEKFRRCLNIDL